MDDRRKRFLDALTEEQRDYFHAVEAATAKAAKVHEQHPEFEIQDLINIALFQRLTPEQRFASVLRKRELRFGC
ncbi:MAG: hypothetical protein J5J00_01570 [Deltaproteobacteria bacterium]|nr:hypothetical protein [Deltaproteobacteria bacterium]